MHDRKSRNCNQMIPFKGFAKKVIINLNGLKNNGVLWLCYFWNELAHIHIKKYNQENISVRVCEKTTFRHVIHGRNNTVLFFRKKFEIFMGYLHTYNIISYYAFLGYLNNIIFLATFWKIKEIYNTRWFRTHFINNVIITILDFMIPQGFRYLILDGQLMML